MHKPSIRDVWMPRLKIGGMLFGVGLFLLGLSLGIGWTGRAQTDRSNECRAAISAALRGERIEAGRWPTVLAPESIPESCRVLGYQAKPLKVGPDGATYRVTYIVRGFRRAVYAETFDLVVHL